MSSYNLRETSSPSWLCLRPSPQPGVKRLPGLPYFVYLKLLIYMYRVSPVVAAPPQVDLLVPQKLKRKGAGALGTALV
jgi:hypothetical protein